MDSKPVPHRYTGAVSQLAAYLRHRTRLDVQKLAPEDRIALALDLGDDDLGLYCAAHSLDRSTGLRRLQGARRIGRRSSRAADAADR